MLELVGVCTDAGEEEEEEGGRENAERRMDPPSRVEGTCTAPAPEAGKLGPAERPERRLTSWRPFLRSGSSVVVVEMLDVGLWLVNVGAIWAGDWGWDDGDGEVGDAVREGTFTSERLLMNRRKGWFG